MPEQTEFLKNVRERFTGVQSKATERWGALNQDARKVFDGLVEKGRVSQRDLSERLQKAGYVGKVEELTRRVKEAQGRAASFVDTTSRDSAAAVAENLRKVASRLDQLAQKPMQVAPASPSTEVH